VSSAAWRIRKRVVERVERTTITDEWMDGVMFGYRAVLDIIDQELEAEAERQFTRPISQQAEQSRMLKEDK